MKHEEIVNAIHQVLRDTMCLPQIEAFRDNARLNEDLYLDSVLVLELILNLETEFGFDIPDEVLTKDDFNTVANLATFLKKRLPCSQQQNIPLQGTPQQDTSKPQKEKTSAVDQGTSEEFEDIKVHCFVSCVSEIIKADPRVDHRPFYFGVWDAEVVVNDQFQLSYHSDGINHDFFRHWYQKLYGVDIHPWYQSEATKPDNINTLRSLLDNKPSHRQVMVMLDMYRLPERENKFNQNPFPHYVLVEETEEPSTWFMTDPDFRWEGPLAKNNILHAIESPSVAGGYYFDSTAIRETNRQDIHDYFLACIKPSHNPMTDAIRLIITQHLSPEESQPLTALSNALKQIPVLAIRKYAYEHGFAYFWREMGLDDNMFEQWCVVIEALVETYKLIQYRAMKIAKFETVEAVDPRLINEVYELLDQQDEREFQVKKHLMATFEQWQAIHIKPCKPRLAQIDKEKVNI